MGLYRDDGLSIFKKWKWKWKRLRNAHKKVFKNNGLDVIINCNMKIVNYLDATFNLNNGTYRPYQKPGNMIQYIQVESNHLPNIIKQIPKAIEKRLSQLSCNEEIFNESALVYEDKLQQAGYQQKLKYNPVNTKFNSKRNHKRNIIRFNPPCINNLSTKIGKYLLNLPAKHFLKNHLHKIFNRSNIKVSYSCIKNMKIIINNHSKNVLGMKSSICTLT